jgi:transposase-like protein
MESHQISLGAIRIDCGTQMRVNQNHHVVGEYAEQLANGVEFPPVTVFTDGTEFWLADGFHRYFAHREAGLDLIACEVRQGTLNDALEYACRANQTHGLQRTNADKRRAVEEYFKIPGHEELNNSEVAKRLGVSVPFVKEVRERNGIKASPKAHVGVGSAEGLKRLNNPNENEGIKRLNNTATDSTMLEVMLPTGHPLQFVTILASRFEKVYLETCMILLHETLKKL